MSFSTFHTFQIQAIQKCQHCQLCVLRENSSGTVSGKIFYWLYFISEWTSLFFINKRTLPRACVQSQTSWGELATVVSDRKGTTTMEVMENVTKTVNETTTYLGQNITDEVTSEQVKSFTKYVNDIHLYGTIIVHPLGIIWNLVSLIVFLKCKAFSTSIGNHLKCISISDSIMLLAGFLSAIDEYWAEQLNIPIFKLLGSMSCKITLYALNVGILSTGLVLCSATIERFLAIAFALKYHSWNTLRTSKIILSVFFIISFGISTYTMFLLEISEKGECDTIENHRETFDIMFTIFPTVIANGICGSLILIFTLIIIGLLFHQLRKRNVLSNNSTSKKEVRISAMLITISLLFLLLRSPKIIAVKLTLAKSGDPVMVKSMSKLFGWFTALNHAVNFIIYMVFLESFRKTFFEMLSWLYGKIRKCSNIFRNENQDNG